MNNAKTETLAQGIRQTARTRAGKYRANPCDLCGKGCPMDYFSDARCNVTGWGLVLHEKCADKLAKLTDEEYAALAASK